MTRLRGTLTALVTPFDRDGRPDEAQFRAHVRRQLDGGIEGLVPCGTTGEAATMTEGEQAQVIRWTVEEASGQVPVIAGVGSSSTAQSVALARGAVSAGASHLLLVTPPYNKPTVEGLIAHFAAVEAAADGLPIVFYNVPGRTALDADEEALAAVCDGVPSVVAVKEATGDLERACRIRERLGDRIALLSGDDFSLLPFYSVGGDGAISVLSNLMPRETVAIYRRYMAGDLAEARRLFYRSRQLTRTLFLQTNPVPVKMAMARLGWVDPQFRLPLVATGEADCEELYAALEILGLR